MTLTDAEIERPRTSPSDVLVLRMPDREHVSREGVVDYAVYIERVTGMRVLILPAAVTLERLQTQPATTPATAPATDAVRVIEWGPLPTAEEVLAHRGRWLCERSGRANWLAVRDGGAIFIEYDPVEDCDRASRWLPVDAKGLPCSRPKVPK